MEVTLIIQGCKAKERVAQKALVTQYSGLLYTICRRYCYRQMDARDVLQEALSLVFRKIDQFDQSRGSFEGWIRKITVNCALQHNRKNKIQTVDILDNKDSLDSVDAKAIQNLSEEEIIALISQLPDQYRIVFNLYVIDGYSHKEIGEQLGINESTSRSNLSRAKGILQNKIIDIEKTLPC